MNLKKTIASTVVAAGVVAGTVLAGAGVASAAPEPPKPEIAVTSTSGLGNTTYKITNLGNTIVPAGVRFNYHSENFLNINLGGSNELNEQWAVDVLGSGRDLVFTTRTPLYPGQSITLSPMKVNLILFNQSTFELSAQQPAGQELSTIDTNYYNNKAGIKCFASILALVQFCTADTTS